MTRRLHEQGVPQDAARERLLMTRGMVLLRIALIAVVFAAAQAAPHSRRPAGYFDAITAVALAYCTVGLIATWRPRRLRITYIDRPAIDLLLVSALAFCSGRAFPEIRAAFTVVPMIAAIRLGPARTAAISALSCALYIVVGLTHPVHAPLTAASALIHTLFVAWAGCAAVAMSILRVRREQRIIALSQARGRLVGQTVEAEERARKHVSNLLHDRVIQVLLTARQDLGELESGDPKGLDRATVALDLALGHLRGTIEDLDPYLLDHLDLPQALQAIAARAARQGGCPIDVEVSTTAGEHTELVASLARELLSNAAKHANASQLKLAVTRNDDVLVLEVSDDGRGFSHAQALAALRAGHIGLAASRERVEAVGGTFDVATAPGAGTRISCELPLNNWAEIDGFAEAARTAYPAEGDQRRDRAGRGFEPLPMS